jgi:hypothetical protein
MAHLWTSLGNAAKVAGIASGVKSMYDAYQALGSPNAFLQSSGETLDRVRSRLQGLTPQQRAEIEQNVASNNGSHKTIHDIEVQLGECVPLTGTFNFEFDLWRMSLDFWTCTVDSPNGLKTRTLWIDTFHSHNFGIAS